MIEALDVRTAASMLGSADKVHAYGTLLSERAKTRALLGRVVAARADDRRALELHEAGARMHAPNAETSKAIAELRARIEHYDADR